MENPTNTEKLDQTVRRYVYGHFVDQQRPPTVAETAAALQVPDNAVEASYQRLHEARVLVLEPGKPEIRFAEPFCAIPTRFRVHAQEKAWWGTCAWDALGIPAALHADAEIVSSCPDCETPLTLKVEGGRIVGADEVIHFAVPANRWWADIFFT
ncbi:MAG: hypothetical protein GY945_08025 [Rhodobacteraceae bacterium]|nr:hypothetical protein [Paracoccaceae bacterium]